MIIPVGVKERVGDVLKVYRSSLLKPQRSQFASDFKESDHPRDDDGKFGDKDKPSAGGSRNAEERISKALNVRDLDRVSASIPEEKINEALQDYAKDIGIEFRVLQGADSATVGDYAKILQGLSELKDAGAPMPKKVFTLADGTFEAKGTLAHFKTVDPDTIWVSRESAGYVSPEGRNSSQDPRHTLAHEIGHMAHFDAVGHEEYLKTGSPKHREEWESTMDEMRLDVKAEDLSDYAMTTPHEFVAEVYAKVKLEGWEPPENVAKWYGKFGGPEL